MWVEEYAAKRKEIEEGDFTTVSIVSKKGDTIECGICWKEFIKKQNKSRFCSAKCGGLHRYQLKKGVLPEMFYDEIE